MQNIKGYIIALGCVALVLVATLVTVVIVNNTDTSSTGDLPTATAPDPANNTASVEDINVTFDEDGAPLVSIPEGYVAAADLYTKVLKEGKGKTVTAENTLTVNYAGWLTDSTEFDSSYESGEPSTFSLSGVITGWQEGLAGKKVGDTVLLVIPPDLAYGASGQNTIPPNATLVFVVEIKDAK